MARWLPKVVRNGALIYRPLLAANDRSVQQGAVARPWHRSFLGFTVKDDPVFRRCIADKAVTRFKDRVRELTRRHRGVSLEKMIADLNPFVRGWAGNFGFSIRHELQSQT